MNERECAHCERETDSMRLGLCMDCHAVESIRVLYLRRRGWTPDWEAHLRHLTQRAKARLPLFDRAEEAVSQNQNRTPSIGPYSSTDPKRSQS